MQQEAGVALTGSAGTPRATRARRGALVALLAVAAALAGPMGLTPGAQQAPPSTLVDASRPPAFRADTWFLPDEELLGFVEIPAGPVLMGSDPSIDPGAFDNERWSTAQPQGTVDVGRFYLGRYEVTVAQFGAFAGATGFKVDPQALDAPPDHPVTFVSWPDALAYCRWLERTLKASRQTPAPLAAVLREGWRVTLPTEAQWEKGARGGDGRIFPWGSAPRRDRANYEAKGAAPVGAHSCPECPFGLRGMSGNVWEWTRSPYQPYPYDESNDRENLEADALWVMRGGHFGDGPRNIRAAVRGAADPGVRRAFIGFRIAISPA